MKILNKPFLLSIFSGLFLALNFYMLFFYYLSPEFEWKSLSYQIKNYAENALLFFTIGFIVSVVFAISIGWPLYLLAKFNSVVNYVTSGLGGAAVTIVPYVVCIVLGWNIPSVTEKSGLIVFLVLATCGSTSGVIFHFLESKKGGCPPAHKTIRDTPRIVSPSPNPTNKKQNERNRNHNTTQ